MRRSVKLVLLCCFIVAASVAVGHADDGERIWTHLVSPRDGDEAIGEVVIEAEVVAAGEVRDVVFFVDGRPIGVLSTAPYRIRFDLGEANQSHSIEVVATDTAGNQAKSRVTTRPIPLGVEYEVELQQLYVTVERNGARVTDLEAGDFTVSDEGKQQELVTFEGGDVPFTAALLIDASASMYGLKMDAARAGATAFIRGMRELDQGKVVVFSDVIQNSTPFSGTQEILTSGLMGAIGQGGTAVNDNLYAAFKLLSARQGRRLVVLLSDGIDSQSVLDGQDILHHARRSQAMVYWIRLLSSRDPREGRDELEYVSAWRTPEEYRRQINSLKELVGESGGRIIPARTAADIEPIFVEILRELRDQYALGYYPSERRNDGSWRRVKVKVDLSGASVRTHEGYLDF
jgi:VWFA-related protein